MKKIPLGNERFSLVDDDDFDNLFKFKWHFNKGYACRNGAKHNGRKDPAIYIHRIVNKTPGGFQTDHINGNKLDNRKKNLRIATNSQNQMNRKPKPNAASKYKGVTKCKISNKWRARIVVRKQTISLGLFTSELSAAIAYNKMAREKFGEFAKENLVRAELPGGAG